jgi:predicted AAA+ superfamily ATPase
MELFWQNAGWQETDKHLLDLKNAPFNRLFPQIDVLTGPALYIIRGARQIGKSSWLKKILSEYDYPNKAFYLSCENIHSYQELSTLLQSIRNSRSLILLDEVSFVKEWTRSVKHEIDSGYKGVIIVTGSHAADLRQGADLMPGRFGSGREIQLQPMDLAEFSECRERAKWPELEYENLIKLFFQVGGMPSALIESGPTGKVPAKAFDTYEKWIVGDAARLGRNKAFLYSLMAQIATTMTTPVSLQTLAKKTEIASHHTVQEYIHFLEDSFALRTCYALDPDTGASRFRKEKKFYFCDPIIYWIAIRMGGLPLPTDWESRVAEMVGFEALSRRADASRERLGYYTSAKGEIDYFSPKRWAIELKWSEVASNISKAYHQIIIPQKLVWTKQNFLKVWPD